MSFGALLHALDGLEAVNRHERDREMGVRSLVSPDYPLERIGLIADHRGFMKIAKTCRRLVRESKEKETA